MFLADLSFPVINNWHAIRSYPLQSLPEALQRHYATCAARFPKSLIARATNHARMLECLIQITGQTPPNSFDATSFRVWDRLFKQLYAALLSPKFYKGVEGTRAQQIAVHFSIRESLAAAIGAHLTWDAERLSSNPVETQNLRVLFETTISLDSNAVSVWQGWPCISKNGGLTAANLLPIYKTFGPEFTAKFYEVCKTYYGGRRKTSLYGVDALAAYLSSETNPVEGDVLTNPDDSRKLFNAIYEHYFRSAYEEKRDISYAIKRWRRPIKSFFCDYIFPSGIMTEPSQKFPVPENRGIPENATHIRYTPTGEVHAKLLTDVPLTVTDDQAINILFKEVNKDLEAAKHWAWSEVRRVANLLERRKTLAKQGGVRHVGVAGTSSTEFPTAWDHPDHLKNAAATYEYFGFVCMYNVPNCTHLFPAPAMRWADELALPSTGMLLPHCAVIVSEHPAVTPAYLEQFLLYDKNGKESGLVQTDAGDVAISTKPRRGPALAEQQIVLSERAKFALNEIIKITLPLREYLRERNRDEWRYLLLTCGKGFSEPRRIRRIATLTSASDSLKRIEASARRSGMSADQAIKFSRKFSLTSLRASCGVSIFIETKSVEKMATALGHARYDPALIDRYLPKALRDFFQERWIRIFQTGIIVQALEGSKNLLEASGFKSMQEVHEFLSNHALRIPQPLEDFPEASSDPWAVGDITRASEVVFALNTDILTTLVSLSIAAKTPNKKLKPHAKYWADMADALIPYIRSASNHRVDIQQHLEAAQALASEQMVAGFAYE